MTTLCSWLIARSWTVTSSLFRVPSKYNPCPRQLQYRNCLHLIPQASFFRSPFSNVSLPLLGTTSSRSLSKTFYSQSDRRLNSTKSILPTKTKNSMTITFELLKQQNAETSNALMDHWKDSAKFDDLSQREGALTLARDDEDGIKLQVGIDYAKSKGVIDPNYIPEPYVTIDVLGKTPEQVADEMLALVEQGGGDDVDATKGSVIVLCGLSGTGKGTTVAKVSEKLQDQKGKQVVTWSNGNIFRSVTLLAATYCEQEEQKQEGDSNIDITKALTKENLEQFMSMLSFGKFGDSDEYDTRIQGLGLDLLVSQVQNTQLKAPKVSKNIPTVAEMTQGEVILFAAKAVEIMKNDGLFVLLEGREQTVNYVRTPHRFILTLSDSSLIGKRRAAQRLMAEALNKLKGSEDSSSEDQVAKVLEDCLEAMVQETA